MLNGASTDDMRSNLKTLDAMPFRTGLSSRPSLPEAVWAAMALRPLQALEFGALRVMLPSGRVLTFTGGRPGPAAEVSLLRSRALRRLALAGDIGLAEGYVDGDWDSPDLTALFELAALNRHSLISRCEPSAFLRLAGRLLHGMNANTRRGSRRNIAAHYDLGNAFYREWLDATMTYSAGIFAAGDDLERAQHRKYRRICDLLNLQPGERVLEIGCGWGGFAEVAARDYGATVHGVTLSREQLAYARARIADRGLRDRADFHLTDYRDLDGTFDHIVSIEMFEAVGEAYWPDYFGVVNDRLRPGGGAVLQSILIDPRRFDAYRGSPDFIQRYIFPGGMLPTRNLLVDHAAAAGLALRDEFAFGPDYGRTLACWKERFEQNWTRIHQYGFDERFRRLWRYYLGYCEGGFNGGAIDVAQFAFVKGA